MVRRHDLLLVKVLSLYRGDYTLGMHVGDVERVEITPLESGAGVESRVSANRLSGSGARTARTEHRAPSTADVPDRRHTHRKMIWIILRCHENPPMVARLYEGILREHLAKHRQMAFVSGPRQVGKTTTCKFAARGAAYLDWDDQDDRQVILRGPAAVVETMGLAKLRRGPAFVIFDEIHNYARWRTFVKGLFDKHADDLRIVVTGSSRLDVYRRGGDSLMGRYFAYRMHPLTVGELLRPATPRR